jgi:hypothetical protein
MCLKNCFGPLFYPFENFEAKRAKNSSKKKNAFDEDCLRITFCNHQTVGIIKLLNSLSLGIYIYNIYT